MPARTVVLEKLVEVERRDPRRHHAGGVHPAHRPRRPARHRRRGPRRRALAARARPAARRRPRLDPHLPAALVASGRRTTWRSTWSDQVGRDARARAARVVVRAVPGRPGRRRARPAGAQATRRRSTATREAMTCHLGDFVEYAGAAPRALATARPSWPASRRGDRASRGRRVAGAAAARRRDPGAGRPSRRARRRPRPGHPVGARRARGRTCSPPTGRSRGCRVVDFPTPVEPLGRLRIPQGVQRRATRRSRRDLASTLRSARASHDRRPAAHGARPRGGRRRREIARAARGSCARTRATAAPTARTTRAGPSARSARARRPTRCERRVEQRTNTSPAVRPGLRRARARSATSTATTVTDRRASGCARLYSELDLLAAECLRAGVWDGLDAAELAAVLSALVFEARRPDDAAAPRLPGGGAASALAEMVRLWARARRASSASTGSTSCASPTSGFAWAAYRWAEGDDLDDGAATTATWPPATSCAGCKQLLDLLGQVADAAAVGTAAAPHRRPARSRPSAAAWSPYSSVA